MICNDTLHTLVFLLVGVLDRSSTAKMCSIPWGAKYVFLSEKQSSTAILAKKLLVLQHKSSFSFDQQLVSGYKVVALSATRLCACFC